MEHQATSQYEGGGGNLIKIVNWCKRKRKAR